MLAKYLKDTCKEAHFQQSCKALTWNVTKK